MKKCGICGEPLNIGIVVHRECLDKSKAAYDKINDFEQTQLAILLAENAALKKRLENAVELPCKVGDMVYYACDVNSLVPIAEGVITNIRIDFDSVNPILIDVDCGNRYLNFNNDKDCILGFTCHLTDINYSWFLTREQAEQRLRSYKNEFSYSNKRKR